ncbi:hypothetical protein ACPRSC_23865, partial [Enterobacter asburiae]|uniref:hypothetical protein n=1 Tax=Enterobacter asburiae TaxID=61645 RepID=UPI003C72C0E0
MSGSVRTCGRLTTCCQKAVSYTQLTLPTTPYVYIPVVRGTLQNKNQQEIVRNSSVQFVSFLTTLFILVPSSVLTS